MKFTALSDFSGSQSKYINIWGRTGFSANGEPFLNPLTLFWTASGIECIVQSRELQLDIECAYKYYRPWISVWINEERIMRFAPEKGRSRITLLQNNEEGAEIRVRILKESQAMAGDSEHRLCIHGFFIPKNKSFSDVFKPLKSKNRFFEFIGDSLTCGEGLEDPVESKEWNSAWQGTRNHFALLTAQRFNADISVTAQSGWGLLCGWNNDPHCTIPPLYPYVCSLAKGKKNRAAGSEQLWDFSRRKTDAVIVNLGSNDEYAFRAAPWKDPATGKEYKLQGKADYLRLQEAAESFLSTIRKKNPAALIIWCYGMFLTGCMPLFREAVRSYRGKTGDERIAFIELSPMNERTQGAQKHPGRLCHKEAADLITAELEKRL